jgi:hypothetical protein
MSSLRCALALCFSDASNECSILLLTHPMPPCPPTSCPSPSTRFMAVLPCPLRVAVLRQGRGRPPLVPRRHDQRCADGSLRPPPRQCRHDRTAHPTLAAPPQPWATTRRRPTRAPGRTRRGPPWRTSATRIRRRSGAGRSWRPPSSRRSRPRSARPGPVGRPGPHRGPAGPATEASPAPAAGAV